MNRWTITFHLNRQAKCPACSCELLADATRFRWGVAMCALCYGHATYPLMETICRLLRDETPKGSTAISNGLIFWTPRGAQLHHPPLIAGHVPHPVCDPGALPAGDVPGTLHPTCR